MLFRPPNELSASELRITELERLMLVRVRDDLRNGTIERYDRTNPPPSWRDGCFLYMPHYAYSTRKFRVVGCIAGLAHAMAGTHGVFADFVERYDCDRTRGEGLRNLFLPPSGVMQRNDPIEVADAIDNFLQTGEPRWISEP